MRKALWICVATGWISCPAWAGERAGGPAPAVARAGFVAEPALGVPAPAAGRKPQRFMLPADGARLERLPVSSRETIANEQAATARWEPGATRPEVTARAGGSYAVDDVLRDQPRPRHRRSPLSAAFVLRLDGNSDSPAFSVGGGGVAAAMWRAVPR